MKKTTIRDMVDKRLDKLVPSTYNARFNRRPLLIAMDLLGKSLPRLNQSERDIIAECVTDSVCITRRVV